jgi:acetyltransferase-like isoleucine patch superfamily enzyme
MIKNNVTLCDDTVLGNNVYIGNNVTFYPRVTIGDNCTIMDGAVLGRPPIATRTMTRPLMSNARPLVIGSNSIIGANAVIYCGSTIGNNVLIGDLASIREGCNCSNDVVIGRAVLVMYDTSIGERTRVIDGAILTGNMTIGPDVFIGPGVCTINDDDVYLKRYGLSPFMTQGPTIQRFALIGAGANLAAGVSIGVGAIVAPSAMVTHDVDDWTVVAGIPAKILRTVEPESRTQILRHFGLPTELSTNPE